MADEIKQTIVIEATLTKLQQDLQKVQGEFKSTFSNIASTGNQILGTLGVGLSAAAIVGFGKNLADVGDKLSDLHDETGLSIQVLGGIKPILDSNNSSLESFAKGFAKAQRSLGDFSGAGKEAAEALKAIKLDPAQLVNSSPDVALEKIVGALAKVENANERAAIAFRIFGKSAAELIPTVLQLAENGIPRLSDSLAEAYKRLGDLKDQTVFLIAKLYNLGAAAALGFDRLFNISDAQRTITALKQTRDEIDLLDKKIRSTQGAPAISFGVFNSSDTREVRRQQQLTELTEQRSKALEKFINLNSKVIQKDQPKPTAQFKGLLPGAADNTDALKNATKAAQSFLEAIDKEIIKLQEQNIAFFQGADAAKRFALGQELAAKKQQVFAELIGRGISPAVANKAIAQAFAGIDTDKLAAKIAAARDEFIQLAREALNSKDALQKVFAVQDADKLKDQFTAVINRIHDAQAEIKDPDLFKGTVQAIEAEFKKAQDQTKLFADVFGDAFDKSGHDVDDLRAKLNKLLTELKGQDKELVIKTKAELDQKSVDDVKEQLRKQIEDIQQRGAIFGPSQVNVPEETARAQHQAAERLIGQRTPQATAEAQNTAQQEQANRIRGVIQDMNRDMRDAAAQAEVLGGAIDLPAQNVDSLTNAIKRLISDGLDPLDPRIQQLKAQLEDAKAAEHFAEAFENIGQAVGDAIEQISHGDFKGALKNLESQVSRAVTEAFVTKPLQEQLKKLGNEIFGGIFGKPGGGTAGGQEASTKVFSTSTNQFAAAVQQFAAIAGVRGAAVPLPTGFGERPAGVEGPALPNGGFFGTPQDTGTGTPAGGESLIAEPGQALKGFLDALGAGIFGGFPLPGGVGLGGILGGIFGGGRGKASPVSTAGVGSMAGSVTGAASDQVAIAGIQAEVTAAQATIEALSTEASATVQGLSTEASGAIEAASTAGTTAIETTGSTAQAAISALQAEAIAAIQAAATAAQSGGGGSSSPLGGIPFIGSFFGGGSSAAGGAYSEAGAGFGGSAAGEGAGSLFSFAHQGGPIGKLHDGGKPKDISALDLGGVNSDAAQRIMKQLGSLKSNERLIIAEDGEFMFSKEAVRDIGMSRLKFANEKHELPRFHDGGGISPAMLREQPMTMPARAREMDEMQSGPSVFQLHVHGVTDADSFKRNSATIWAQGSRMMDRGRKYR